MMRNRFRKDPNNSSHWHGQTSQTQPNGAAEAPPLRIFVETQITNGARKWRMGAGAVLEVLLLLALLTLPLVMTETLDLRDLEARNRDGSIKLWMPPKGDSRETASGSRNPSTVSTGQARKVVPVSDLRTKISFPFNPGIALDVSAPGSDEDSGPGLHKGVLWGDPSSQAGPGSGWFPGVSDRQPPPPSQPIVVGGDVRPPWLLRQVQPVYPAIARGARIQGDVVLRALLDADGRVRQVEVIKGHALLVPSALKAVRQWRYQPTYLNGYPVPVLLEVVVKFRLSR